MSSTPPARGVRRDWGELPEGTLREIERVLGGRVAVAETQPAGFSPGVAARVTLDDGRHAFVKAVGPEPNPTSPDLHRRELRVVSALPPLSVVPPFLGGVDEGEGGWVALAFEDVGGRHPGEPWREDELTRVLEAAGLLVEALTPSPVELEPAGQMLAEGINSWHLLRDDPPAELDEWSKRHARELATLEAGVAEAVRGDTLLHLDIRADNILLTDERAYVVDWPHAHVGAPWLDAVAFAPSVRMQGGPEPEAVLHRWPGGEDAAADQLTAAVASLAGFFTHRALLPPPPGLPTLRAFQAGQGAVARRWLAERTGLAQPKTTPFGPQ